MRTLKYGLERSDYSWLGAWGLEFRVFEGLAQGMGFRIEVFGFRDEPITFAA